MENIMKKQKVKAEAQVDPTDAAEQIRFSRHWHATPTSSNIAHRLSAKRVKTHYFVYFNTASKVKNPYFVTLRCALCHFSRAKRVTNFTAQAHS
jgi:hypothetical protein